MRLFNLIALLGFTGQILAAQETLSSRVLVVYAENDSDSRSVAAHYAAKRGISPENLCAVSLPDPGVTSLNGQSYTQFLKQPVQDCLRSVGEQNILYIVLAYLRPYAVNPGAGIDNYALDSYLADIWDQYAIRPFNPYPTKEHPYYVDSQSQGNAFAPFQSLARHRELHSRPLIYSVWRLDGPTPEIAMNLVDNAMLAEAAGGPISNDPGASSNACLDLVIDPTNFPDSGYRAADWDLFRAADFLNSTGRFQVVEDENGEVFGDAPSSDCRNTSLYAGWYNYGRYNDAFSWNIGSIGWDLDSAALADPRDGVWWGSNALRQGVTVTSGPMNEPYLEGMARPAGVIRNLLEGANVGDAFLRNTRWLKWMILNVGDPLYTPFAAKVSPFDRRVHSNSLSLSPRQLVGGQQSSAAVVTIAEPAPPEGLQIELHADNDSVGLPSTITIPAGESRATFALQTGAVPFPVDVRVTASADSIQIANTLSLYPLLSELQLSPDVVTSGGNATATILLNANAPAGGITVQIWPDDPSLVTAPESIYVPSGRSRTSFAVSASSVMQETRLNITASFAGAQASATLTIRP